MHVGQFVFNIFHFVEQRLPLSLLNCNILRAALHCFYNIFCMSSHEHSVLKLLQDLLKSCLLCICRKKCVKNLLILPQVAVLRERIAHAFFKFILDFVQLFL